VVLRGGVGKGRRARRVGGAEGAGGRRTLKISLLLADVKCLLRFAAKIQRSGASSSGMKNYLDCSLGPTEKWDRSKAGTGTLPTRGDALIPPIEGKAGKP